VVPGSPGPPAPRPSGFPAIPPPVTTTTFIPMDLSKDPFLAPHAPPSPGTPPPTSTVVIHQPDPAHHPPPAHLSGDPREAMLTDMARRIFVLEARLGRQENVAHRLESKMVEVEVHMREPHSALSPQAENMLLSRVNAMEGTHQAEVHELRKALDDAIALGREQEQFQRWQQGSLREWDKELAEAERRIHNSASALKAELNHIGPAVSDLEFRTSGLKDIVSTCGAGVAQLDKLMVENKRRCGELQKEIGACERGVAVLGSNVEGQRLRVEGLEARVSAVGHQSENGEVVPLWQALRKLEEKVGQEAQAREDSLRALHSHASTGFLGHSDRHRQNEDAIDRACKRFEDEVRRLETKLTEEVHAREKGMQELHEDAAKHKHHAKHHEAGWKEQCNTLLAEQQQLVHRVDELTSRVSEVGQDVAKHRHHAKHHEAGLKEHYESSRAGQQRLAQRVEELADRVRAIDEVEKLILREVEQRESSMLELREHVHAEHERQHRRLASLHSGFQSQADRSLPLSDIEADSRTVLAREVMIAEEKDEGLVADDARRIRRENVEGTIGKLRGQLKIIKRELAASAEQDSEKVMSLSDSHIEQENLVSFDAGQHSFAFPVEPIVKPQLPAPTVATPVEVAATSLLRAASVPSWSPLVTVSRSPQAGAVHVNSKPISPRWPQPQPQG